MECLERCVVELGIPLYLVVVRMPTIMELVRQPVMENHWYVELFVEMWEEFHLDTECNVEKRFLKQKFKTFTNKWPVEFFLKW